ncbi:MAG: hypothetical protein AAF215_31090 [Cyanobacteria bacterium P01_A01_bin.123]
MKLKSIRRRSLQDVSIVVWKRSLQGVLNYYDSKRGRLISFFPKLFAFFIVVNIACYWMALLTAYPQNVFGEKWIEYYLMQFPVGVMGALFDSLSFFITIYIARRAIHTTSTLKYVAHLSVDLIIAFLATWWVLFVFTVSGWFVDLVLSSPETISERANLYEQRVTSAISNPTNKNNLKNIYFGLVMGFSALLPTLTHLGLSLQAFLRVAYRRWQLRQAN